MEPQPGTLAETDSADRARGAGLAEDALDHIEGRFLLAEAARRANIPYLHGTATGWRMQVLTIPAGSTRDISVIYGHRRTRTPEEVASGIPGPTAIADIEDFEAVHIPAGRTPACVENAFLPGRRTGQMPPGGLMEPVRAPFSPGDTTVSPAGPDHETSDPSRGTVFRRRHQYDRPWRNQCNSSG
jgi:hypothetical protein